MRAITSIVYALIAALPIAGCSNSAILGGVDYAIQYDYREFYSVVDHKTFRVVLDGNPFPGLSPEQSAARLLPVMQANKPIPPLTFTYAVPPEKPRPDYRVVLIFDPANDLGADSVCATGEIRHRPQVPGKIYLFGIYCRNELALSQTTGRVDATTPEDPRVGQLFKDMFAVLFNPAPGLLPQRGRVNFN